EGWLAAPCGFDELLHFTLDQMERASERLVADDDGGPHRDQPVQYRDELPAQEIPVVSHRVEDDVALRAHAGNAEILVIDAVAIDLDPGLAIRIDGAVAEDIGPRRPFAVAVKIGELLALADLREILIDENTDIVGRQIK